ncbi:hypothetical protein BV22DRAFT_1198214 [Leucogyrophana mollusca]|uniref:Uncharacterized protein n=1 Tax=Leucogyrophana mollusca TaxID=85980 RepID=A0ACB8B7I5_9AGAM|nr:hypothetical protein BV22DRAFT_1198214 [Leucogyrophana mollusca]
MSFVTTPSSFCSKFSLGNMSVSKMTKPRSTRAKGKPIANQFFGYVLEQEFLLKYAKEHQVEVYRSGGMLDIFSTMEVAIWKIQMSGAEFARLVCLKDRTQATGVIMCLHIASNLRRHDATEARAQRLKTAMGVDEDPQWLPLIYRR